MFGLAIKVSMFTVQYVNILYIALAGIYIGLTDDVAGGVTFGILFALLSATSVGARDDREMNLVRNVLGLVIIVTVFFITDDHYWLASFLAMMAVSLSILIHLEDFGFETLWKLACIVVVSCIGIKLFHSQSFAVFVFSYMYALAFIGINAIKLTLLLLNRG